MKVKGQDFFVAAFTIKNTYFSFCLNHNCFLTIYGYTMDEGRIHHECVARASAPIWGFVFGTLLKGTSVVPSGTSPDYLNIFHVFSCTGAWTKYPPCLQCSAQQTELPPPTQLLLFLFCCFEGLFTICLFMNHFCKRVFHNRKGMNSF